MCLLLSCLMLFMAFAAVGCAPREEEQPKKPAANPVSITLSYDEANGELSWAAVENAVKYTVSLTRTGEKVVTQEVTEPKIVLTLKAGSTRVAVAALDGSGSELGAGSKTITVEVDFGAPDEPKNLIYDKTSGKLTWSACEGAAKYIVNATSVTDAEFEPVNAEATQTEKQLDLGKGIFDLSVYAVSAGGSKGKSAVIEYRSYTDDDFAANIGETDFYRILDFEDEDVLDIARQSNYIEWDTGVLSSCVYGISEEIDVNESVDEDGDGEPDLSEFGNLLHRREPSDSKILELEQVKKSEGNYFAGVAFNLQESITDFGRIYFDVYRAMGSAGGVVFDDGEGHRAAVPVDWDFHASFFDWATVSITKSAILKKAPGFTGIKEITFYFRNANGGRIYFDNVRFDKTDLGDMGELSYTKQNAKFVWDEVESAVSYELYIDESEEPLTAETAELVLDDPLADGAHEVKLVAVNGAYKREKTFEFFINKDARFNVPVEDDSDEYIIAAFDTQEYKPYLSADSWMAPVYDIDAENGQLDVTFGRNWANNPLIYTFPEPLDGKNIYKLHIRFKISDWAQTFLLYYNVGSGNDKYLKLSGSDIPACVTLTDESEGWKKATVDFTKLPDSQVINSLSAIKFSINDVQYTASIGMVTYEKYPSAMTGVLGYGDGEFPVFSDIEFDLSKLSAGYNIPEGQLSATLRKGDGEAAVLDLTQTAYKFEEGEYTLNVMLSNSVVTVTAAKMFTVHDRGYTKYSDEYTVIADFDGDYYESSLTTVGGSAAEFVSHNENDDVLSGCSDGAVKLSWSTVNWNGRVVYNLNKTVNVNDFDDILIRFYKTNTENTTSKCNYSLYLSFGDDSEIMFGITAYNFEQHRLKWATAQVTSAMLKAKGITSFDRINVTASVNYAVAYIDEIGFTTNEGFLKPVEVGGNEYILADFAKKTAVTYTNHPDVSVLDITDYLYITMSANEYKQNWANACVEFTLSESVDLTTISTVTVRGKNITSDDFIIYFFDGNNKTVYGSGNKTYCSLVENDGWQEFTVDFTGLGADQANWTYDNGVPQGNLTKFGISTRVREAAFVIDKITYTLRA